MELIKRFEVLIRRRKCWFEPREIRLGSRTYKAEFQGDVR